MMAKLVESRLTPAGFEVETLTVEQGPRMIIDPNTLAESAQHVINAVRRRLSEQDSSRVAAVIVGAIGDPARNELAAELDVPVIGIGQASILAAANSGRRFGMATSTPLLRDSLNELVRQHNKSGQFTGIRFTRSDPLVLAAAPQQQYEELAAAVRTCVEEDGAEAIIIAGGPLSQTARRLATMGMAEIIEPLPSASELVIAALAHSNPNMGTALTADWYHR